MRIAVVGVGVAGSYLLASLGDEHEVVGFDHNRREEWYPICAWGTSLNTMRELCREVGLNFDDYVIHVGREMTVDLGWTTLHLKLKGLCTFDKGRFEMDLFEGRDVRFGVKVRRPPEGFDLIIDSTGFNRVLLPKPKRDYFIPTLEYLVKYRSPPFDDFYVKPMPELSGYLWYFPLGDGLAHVGAGDYYKRHVEVLQRFMNQNGGEILRRLGRPVRIAPPKLMEPIIHGNIVGVGESIGTVYPVLGEGIIPSIISAKILKENLPNLQRYRREILRRFNIYWKIFELVRKKMTGTFRWITDWHLVLSLYLHMRLNEDRYGIEARFGQVLDILKRLKKR